MCSVCAPVGIFIHIFVCEKRKEASGHHSCRDGGASGQRSMPVAAACELDSRDCHVSTNLNHNTTLLTWKTAIRLLTPALRPPSRRLPTPPHPLPRRAFGGGRTSGSSRRRPRCTTPRASPRARRRGGKRARPRAAGPRPLTRARRLPASRAESRGVRKRAHRRRARRTRPQCNGVQPMCSEDTPARARVGVSASLAWAALSGCSNSCRGTPPISTATYDRIWPACSRPGVQTARPGPPLGGTPIHNELQPRALEPARRFLDTS